MRFTTIAFIGAVAAAPAPQFDLGALLGGLTGGSGTGAPGAAPDLGALLGGLGGLLGGAPASGAPGGLPAFDLGSLLGGSSGPVGDVNVIITQYGSIKDKVTAQDAYISKINGSAPADLIEKLNKFGAEQVDAIKAGTKAIDGLVGAVDLLSAANLQGPGADVTAAEQLAIENLKKAAPIIAKVPGAKDAALKVLNAQLEALKKFNEAVNKKVPAFAVAIAQGEGQKSVDAITDAINVFSKL
jgi:hypothetical protein